MKTGIKLDKRSGQPFYRQLIAELTMMIRGGRLRPGDRIPSERDLSLELGIARGTVKKAYGELERAGLIEAASGFGSFVSGKRKPSTSSGRHEEAMHLIEGLLDSLEAMKFSGPEMRNYIELKILEREERVGNLHVAVIDCNPEVLELYERQLHETAPVSVTKFLLDDIRRDSSAENRLRDFRLILTTSTHYGEILEMLPGIGDRLMQVIFSPGRECVVEFSRITSTARIGVVCRSRRFYEIIRNMLSAMGGPRPLGCMLYGVDDGDMDKFLSGKDIVIAAPGLNIASGKESSAALQRFTLRGGKVIIFDYQIERGSILHASERIKELLTK